MWVKICGITTLADATFLATTKADACGLNFYPDSKRFVTTEAAIEIRKCLGTNIEVVGVFVNSPPEEVSAIAKTVGLDTVQFHGNESAADIAKFASLSPETRIVRAFRIGDEGFAAVERDVQELRRHDVSLHAILVDAYHPNEFGGTGHRIDPSTARDWIAGWTAEDVILAGGLKPDNVASAVAMIQPWGIDVASGVETAPGIKARADVQAFIENAKQSPPR